jgi:transcription antitermination factor NusG
MIQGLQRTEETTKAAGEGVFSYLQPLWYAVYTCANHERKIAAQFQRREVEYLLPQYDSVRKWKDRRVRLQLPLFPGYVFVRLALENRLRVLEVPGVARLVGFGGQPCALQDEEIEALRACLDRKICLQPHPYVRVGQRVRVKTGPLQGLCGLVTRKKNGLRFIISFDLIARSASVEMQPVDLEPL